MSESLGATRSRTTAFGAALRSMRLAAGLSQGALAERAGLSEKAVGALERGDRTTPRPATIVLLAQAVGASPADRDRLLAAAHAESRPTDPARPTDTGAASLARHGLLVPPTPLLGRQQDIAAVRHLISPSGAAARLLTLIGPGGVGKTRVALAVALELVDAFADDVWFVDLSPLRDYRLVAASVARALDVRESGGRSAHDLLIDALRERQALLVLDNFEHVLDAAPLVADLLSNCPRLTVLVTSRTPLRLRAERRFLLEPLSVPHADGPHTLETVATSPAVQLFVDRAQAIVPDFELTPKNGNALGAICRRLDGMPLAIELAAARVPLLSPDALLQRLERPFPELSSRIRDLPSRHQTLYNTLTWSYELLGPAEQALFRRLAVFAGGWTLEAAEAVCGGTDLPSEAVLDGLRHLVESSLVQVLDAGTDERRFGLLEIVREYAEGQLIDTGEAPTIRGRHCDWYVAWVERVLPELTGPDQAAWYRRLAVEFDNCRAARACSLADPTGAEGELRLAAALGRYFHLRAPGSEGHNWLTEALARGPGAASVERATALTWLGQLEYLDGEAESGRARLAEAVAMVRKVGDRRLLPLVLRHQALYVGDRVTELVLLNEAVAAARAADEDRELALALSYLGIIHEYDGDTATAASLYDEAVSTGRRARDVAATADGLLRLGRLRLTRGEYAEAAAAMDEALALSRTIGYEAYVALAQRQLARVALAQWDLAEAQARVYASLALARQAEPGTEALGPLRTAASVAVDLGHPGLAVRLLAAEAAWRARHPLGTDSSLWARWVLSSQGVEADLSRARAALGDAEFASAWAEGSAMTLKAALDEALAVYQAAASLSPC